MKKLVLILFCVLISIATQANEGYILRNTENSLLIGERDSILESPEKRWAVYFGGVLNYRFPISTFKDYLFRIRPGIEALFFLRIHKWGYVSTGLSYNIYTYNMQYLNGLGQYNEHELANRMAGISIYYLLDIFPDKRVFPSIQLGFIANQLQYSRSTIYYSTGNISEQADYQRGSKSVFFAGAVNLNISIGKNLIFVGSLGYMQQNRSFVKTSPSPPFDIAKIMHFNAGIKLKF